MSGRDQEESNKKAAEFTITGNNAVRWPDKKQAPKAPKNPTELAIRVITVLKILPELPHSEFRYSVLEAASPCLRFLVDLILPVRLCCCG